jgi:hypothetical protein
LLVVRYPFDYYIALLQYLHRITTVMARKKATPEIEACAEANSYERGAYREEDRERTALVRR